MRIADLVVFGALIAICTSSPVLGQASVRGLVVDSAGRPLPGVEVVVERTGLLTRTLMDGSFSINALESTPVVLLFRLVGFTPVRDTFSIKPGMMPIRITLEAAAQELPETRVEAPAIAAVSPKMRGFYERKDLGFGRFITDSILRQREHSSLTDVLRRVPGLTMVYLPDGGGVAVQMSRARTTKTKPIGSTPKQSRFGKEEDVECYAQVYLDGIRVYAPGQRTADRRGFSLDQFEVRELQGIEIYSGAATTPAQFNVVGAACGTILLWTREKH